MLGEVPLALPLLFLPIAANAYLLAGFALGFGRPRRLARIGLGVAILVGLDLLLDPAAVALGFWSYAAGGAYYGVPLTNVLGWVLSASVVIIGLDATLDRARLAERRSTCPFMLDDLVSFALLWGVVAAMYGLIVPPALALGDLGVLSRVGPFGLPHAFDRWRPSWPTG